MIWAVSASGEKAPPLYLFPGKRLSPDLIQGAPEGSLVGVQESGWVDTPSFKTFVGKVVEMVNKTRSTITYEGKEVRELLCS